MSALMKIVVALLMIGCATPANSQESDEHSKVWSTLSANYIRGCRALAYREFLGPAIPSVPGTKAGFSDGWDEGACLATAYASLISADCKEVTGLSAINVVKRVADNEELFRVAYFDWIKQGGGSEPARDPGVSFAFLVRVFLVQTECLKLLEQ